MTAQEKIEIIRQKCVEANPEIVKLKFGCIIRMTGEKQPDYIKTPVPITSVKPMSDGCWETPWGCFHPKINKKEYIIIGCPIRLADVLLAIKKRMWFDLKKIFEDYTDLLNTDWANLYFFLIENWNLRKDDLTLQDEPTIDFIYSLLK